MVQNNLMIGIRDPHYPEYRDVATPKKLMI